MSSNGLKKKLIDALSQKEVLILARLIVALCGPKGSHLLAERYLSNVSVKTLFGFLHKELFGRWGCAKTDFIKVMENLDQVKNMLQESAAKSYHFSKKPSNDLLIYPQMPKELQVSNGIMKNVLVAAHAWERFCERFRPKENNPDRIVASIQASFDRAQAVTLKRGHEVYRLITNNFVESEYLFDQILKCRFVVIPENGKFTLVTVEAS